MNTPIPIIVNCIKLAFNDNNIIVSSLKKSLDTNHMLSASFRIGADTISNHYYIEITKNDAMMSQLSEEGFHPHSISNINTILSYLNDKGYKRI